MKDLCQYGNRPEDEWEILPWIPDPRPPFKIWAKPEQIAPFFLIPHAVGELSGGKAVDLSVNLYLPDLEGMVLVIDRVFDFYSLAGGLPVVVKDVHTEQFALTVRAKGFIFPSHVMPHTSVRCQPFSRSCTASILQPSEKRRKRKRRTKPVFFS